MTATTTWASPCRHLVCAQLTPCLFAPHLPALAAALLFGASTPLAKVLVGDVPPLLLAGLLYLGSGLGLSILLALRWAKERASGQAVTPLTIPRKEIAWLLCAVVFGGMLGPRC